MLWPKKAGVMGGKLLTEAGLALYPPQVKIRRIGGKRRTYFLLAKREASNIAVAVK